MGKEEDYKLKVVLFEGKDTAESVLKDVQQLKKDKKIVLEDVVAAKKDDKGKIKLTQGRGLTGKKGALGWGTAGLLVGTLAGGPLAWAALGASLGAAGSQIKKVFNNDEMKEISDALDGDSSMLFLMISDEEEGAFDETMEKVGGKVYGFLIAEEGLVAMGGVTEDEAFLSVMQKEVNIVEFDATVKLDQPEE